MFSFSWLVIILVVSLFFHCFADLTTVGMYQFVGESCAVLGVPLCTGFVE